MWDLLDPDNPDPVAATIRPSQVRKASEHIAALLEKHSLDKEWWLQARLVQTQKAEVNEKARMSEHNKKASATKVIYLVQMHMD